LKLGTILSLSYASNRSLGNPNFTLSNKLLQLALFSKYELKTPDYLVTSSKNEMINFKEKHGEIITKCLSDGAFIKYNGINYGHYTSVVD
jgi:hypothetical protein